MSDTETSTAIPRVWIGSLAAYNEGRLIGEWVDAVDVDELEKVAHRVVARGGGEEFACFDREHFGDLIGEYTQLSTIAEIGTLLLEHGDPFRLFCEHAGISEADAVDAGEDFEGSYLGEREGDAGAAYAEELALETRAIDEHVSWPLTCIDWLQAWQWLETDGYWESNGHVFGPY